MTALILLAMSLSIDSFGIGISYGIRKISITFCSMLTMSFVSLFICAASAFFGSMLPLIFTKRVSHIIGSVMLFLRGAFIIRQTLAGDKPYICKHKDKAELKNSFSFFIKFLGITINIIKSPEQGDIDKSNSIEPKEAFYLGTALSIDSVGAAVGVGAVGLNPFLFAAISCAAQILFLILGIMLGGKINFKSSKKNIPALFSGIVLIVLAISQLFGFC